jgi:hypothetical protein
MGQSISRTDHKCAHVLYQKLSSLDLEINQYVECVYAYRVEDRLFLVVGERHTPIGKSDLLRSHAFYRFMRENCGDTKPKWDIFLEQGLGMRENYRNHDIPLAKAEEHMTLFRAQEEAGMNSMGIVRGAGSIDCSNHRVHAIDARMYGMLMLMMMDDAPKATIGHIHGLIMPQLIRDNFNYLLKILPSSANKSVAGDLGSDVLFAYVNWLEGFMHDAQLNQESPVYQDWSTVACGFLDLYAFARMLRNDNHCLNVTYVGSHHADFMAGMFQTLIDVQPAPSTKYARLGQWRRPGVYAPDRQADHEAAKTIVRQWIDHPDQSPAKSGASPLTGPAPPRPILPPIPAHSPIKVRRAAATAVLRSAREEEDDTRRAEEQSALAAAAAVAMHVPGSAHTNTPKRKKKRP